MKVKHPEIYKDALDMQNAVNTRALLKSLVDLWPKIMEDAEARGEPTDTESVNCHPVVKVWLAKLADLAGISVDDDHNLNGAFDTCADRASSTGDCPKGYSLWVKRLGQTHLAKDGLSPSDEGYGLTLCGMPMLGNNYAKVIPESERKTCFSCWEKMNEARKNESTTNAGV